MHRSDANIHPNRHPKQMESITSVLFRDYSELYIFKVSYLIFLGGHENL